MEFRKDGLLYQTAYFLAKKPERTNLCSLFWRLMFALFVIWPLALIVFILAVVMSIIFNIIGTPIAFLLFGYRPGSFTSFEGFMNNFPVSFKRISWWPKVMGLHVMPGIILLVVGIVWLAGYLIKLFFVNVVFASTLGIVIFTLGVIALLGFIAYSVLHDSEGYQVVREYAKAKKAKYCPLVEFV